MPEGTLVVVVMKAKNLHNNRSVSKQNPFCTIRISSESQRTKAIVRGGQNPKWDEELRFRINRELDSRHLKIAVFDQNGSNVDIIGDTLIPLAPAYNASVEEGYDDWHQIRYNGKYVGEVYLETTFYSRHRKKQQPKPVPQTSSTSISGKRALPQLPGAVSCPDISTTLQHSSSMSSISTDSISLNSSHGSTRRPLPLPPGQPGLRGSQSSTNINRNYHQRTAATKSPYFNGIASSHSMHNLSATASAPILDEINDLRISNPETTRGRLSMPPLPEPPQHKHYYEGEDSFYYSKPPPPLEEEDNFWANHSSPALIVPDSAPYPDVEMMPDHRVDISRDINAWYGKAMFERLRKKF